MNTIEKIKAERPFNQQMLLDAEAIAAEITRAIAFPEENQELSKVGTMGYMGSVGSPHQWWESHCQAYKEVERRYTRDKDFHTVCLLADALLSQLSEDK